MVGGFILFSAIYAGIVWAGGFTLAPQLDGWRAPRPIRAVGATAISLLCLFSAFLLVGARE